MIKFHKAIHSIKIRHVKTDERQKKSMVSFNSIILLVQFLVLIIVTWDRYYHWGTRGEAMETLCYYFFCNFHVCLQLFKSKKVSKMSSIAGNKF